MPACPVVEIVNPDTDQLECGSYIENVEARNIAGLLEQSEPADAR
jgi:hypothetical protein